MSKLIVISWPEFFPGEAQVLTALLESPGVWRLHIRKPGADADEIAALLRSIPRDFYSKISLHDHIYLAKEFGLGGVHLNSRFPQRPSNWQGLVSRSLHSLDKLSDIQADYAFLSPLYPSISKPGYKPTFSLADAKCALSELKQTRSAQASAPMIFALGGVTRSRLPEIEAAGFAGAAMLGDIWRAPLRHDHFRLQFITNPVDHVDIVTQVKLALEGGCRWIQLRMKDATTTQIIQTGIEVSELCRYAGATFIIDDHVELVQRLYAQGVHLGKNDMPVAQARSILGPLAIIGATANTFADVEAAISAGADYVGLGPYRFTSTKKNLSPVLGLDGYNGIMSKCRDCGFSTPVVAIGGITQADVEPIMLTGVNGIAVSGTIITAADPVHTTASLLELLH